MPRPRQAKPRLLIAEDHVVVAHALCGSLRSRHHISGMVHRGNDVLPFLQRTQIDCLILDLGLPDVNGLQIISNIRRQCPETVVVVLTMHADRTIADYAIAQGASAFVPKICEPAELELAIRDALAGKVYRSPRIPKATHRSSLDAHHPGLRDLTPRQEDILLKFGEGRSAKEIARLLGVGQSTITFHKKNIMRTIGTETDGGLVMLAVLYRSATLSNREA